MFPHMPPQQFVLQPNPYLDFIPAQPIAEPMAFQRHIPVPPEALQPPTKKQKR